MAPDVRATGDVSSIVGNYYDKLMLERLIDNAVIYKMADKRPMPAGTGTTINMNRFTNFPVVTAAFTEGETPTISYLSGTAVTATLFQVGAFTAVSDILELASFSQVIKDCVENFGDSAATTIDKWIMSKIMSLHATDSPMGTIERGDDVRISTWFGAKQGGLSTVFISNDGLLFTAYDGPLWNYMSVTGNCVDTPDAGYAMDLYKLAKIAGKLRINNCRPFSDGYYKAVMHSKQVNQIMRSGSWEEWQKYVKPEMLEKGQVGAAYGIKIYESNAVFEHHSDVLSQYTNFCAYFAPIYGQGAFAVTEINTEKGVKIYTKAPNQYDTSNPLNQWSTIGWKINMAVAALNANCGYVLMTLAGA